MTRSNDAAGMAGGVSSDWSRVGPASFQGSLKMADTEAHIDVTIKLSELQREVISDQKATIKRMEETIRRLRKRLDNVMGDDDG